MNYPNFDAPSPQEIYDGLKMIPNSPQGKQMLSQLAQQGKQTGSVEGGIAAALLNSYNKMQPPAAPPQGQVVDQVIAQAQPPVDPNMMGLAMPGLENVAQQSAQQMATGGIVALADGGLVRGFEEGGSTEAYPSWGTNWTLNDLAQQAWDWGTTPIGGPSERVRPPSEAEYYRDTEASPAKQRELDKAAGMSGFSALSPELLDKTYDDALEVSPELSLDREDKGVPSLLDAAKVLSHEGGIGDIKKAKTEKKAEEKAIEPAATKEVKAASPSFDEQMAAYIKALGVPPNVAAEMISQQEHRKAQREKMNVFETIASGLSGYLSSYGSGAHRAGAGLASMLGTMGEHRREEDKAEESLDALRREQMMHEYSVRHPIAAHLISQMEASKAAGAKSAAEMAKVQYQGGIDLAKAQIGVNGDLAVQELINQNRIDEQALQNLGSYRVEQLKQQITRGELSPNDVASIINKQAEDITVPFEERMGRAGTAVQTARGLLGRSPRTGGSGYTGLGGGMYLSGTPTS
jgi:hypothetical protein